MEASVMLEQTFNRVYNRFKIHFYQEIFREMPEREATLTATEAFAVEIIYSLGEPTISEFASFVHISLPNATYRINSLVKKGYIEKVPSPADHREIHLRLTEHFYHYYNISCNYIHQIMADMDQKLTESEQTQFVAALQTMLTIMDKCEGE
jgi:DNA-binding MarR family transcriptional regulator